MTGPKMTPLCALFLSLSLSLMTACSGGDNLAGDQEGNGSTMTQEDVAADPVIGETTPSPVSDVV